MALFDWLSGRKTPARGVARKSAADLRAALMAVNRDTAPFVVRDGAPEGVDLVAEWRIVDARWYEIFAKAGITRVFKVLMKIDEPRGQVRATDQEWTVEWRAGVPHMSLSGSAFRGRSWEKSYEAVYAFREDFTFGKVYEYRFDTGEIKDPLIEATTASGWTWQGVAFGKL